MYSEWTSLSLLLENHGQENQNVLDKFGLSTSKEVTLGVVRQLASNLGISQPADPSPLTTDKEVIFLYIYCRQSKCTEATSYVS